MVNVSGLDDCFIKVHATSGVDGRGQIYALLATQGIVKPSFVHEYTFEPEELASLEEVTTNERFAERVAELSAARKD